MDGCRYPLAGTQTRGASPEPMDQPLSENEYLFTSESVTEGHPDKVADQISDKGLLTRDYGFFLENRLRERYGLEGVPLVIDYHGRDENRR